MARERILMDWDNYDPHEHARRLIDKHGNCDAPSGSICKKCLINYEDKIVLCGPVTAYEVAKKFLNNSKIKSIW